MKTFIAIVMVLLLVESVPAHVPKHEPWAYPQYAFDYAVKDPHTGDHKTQWEKRDGDLVKGEYSLVEPDGSIRIVEYTADAKHGFNAVVKKIGNAVHVKSNLLHKLEHVLPHPIVHKPLLHVHKPLEHVIHKPIFHIPEMIHKPLFDIHKPLFHFPEFIHKPLIHKIQKPLIHAAELIKPHLHLPFIHKGELFPLLKEHNKHLMPRIYKLIHEPIHYKPLKRLFKPHVEHELYH